MCGQKSISNIHKLLQDWTLKNGQKVPKQTTKGHQLLLQFCGNETEWMDLQTVKDSNPIEVAEFAIVNQLDQQPAFAWWV